MKHPLALGLIIAAALPLSGCALFKGKSARLDGKEAGALAKAQEADSYFTDLGRRQLDAGRPGAALEAFRQALASGEEAAPALNGMGVVYARLGRYEVAHQLFSQAAERDPANQKYAANLARLMNSPLFAMRREGDMAAELVRLAQVPSADTSRASFAFASLPQGGDDPQAAISTLRSRLVRAGPGEFRIHSAMAQPAPVRTALNSASQRFRPLATVEFARKPQPAAAEPEVQDPSLNTRPRVVNVTGFKPAVRVDLAPSAKTVRLVGKEARGGN